MPPLSRLKKDIRLPDLEVSRSFRYDFGAEFTQQGLEAIRKKLESLSGYEEKLRSFFVGDFLSVIPKGISDQNNAEGKRDEIDLVPKTDEQRKTYNLLVRQLLKHSNEKGDTIYVTAAWHIKKLEEKIKSNRTKAIEEIVSEELNRVKKFFTHADAKTNLTYLNFRDNPDALVVTDDDPVLRAEIFHYLLANRQIDYSGQFIHWWHHLQILNAEEKLVYYKYLNKRLKKPTPHGELLQYRIAVPPTISQAAKFNQAVKPVPKTIAESKNSQYNAVVSITSDKVETFYSAIKGFFLGDDHANLHSLLNGKPITRKLLFKGAGNKLANAFKQLYNARYITGITKEQLNEWIADNFQYVRGKQIADFNKDYLEQVVSTNDIKRCPNPIIDIDIRTGDISLAEKKKKDRKNSRKLVG